MALEEKYIEDFTKICDIFSTYGNLQDFYDETRGAGSFRDRYAELVADERISRRTVKAIDLSRLQ